MLIIVTNKLFDVLFFKKILKDAITGSKNINKKLGDWDLVTEYDKKIEDIIIGKLKNLYPSHK